MSEQIAAQAQQEASAPMTATTALTVLQQEKFFFKKDKLGNKRADVELQIPHATPALIVDIFNKGGKPLDLLLDVVNDVFYQHTKMQINDESKPVNTQEELNMGALDWFVIAALPPAERKGSGISAETWEAFAVDYVSVMNGRIEKTAEQIATACALFLKRLAPVKWRKPYLRALKTYLDMWYANTQEAESFTDLYKFLDGKITEYLVLDPATVEVNI